MYARVRGSTRLASRESAQTSQSEHAGREGSAYGELRAMRLPRLRVAGRPLCLCGWAATAHVGSRASVQELERRGEVKQAHRYRRNGVVVQAPAVCHVHGEWQINTTAAAFGGDEEGDKSYTGVRGSTWLASGQSAQTSRSEHTGRESSAYGELRAMRLPRVAVGGHGPCWVEGVRTV